MANIRRVERIVIEMYLIKGEDSKLASTVYGDDLTCGQVNNLCRQRFTRFAMRDHRVHTIHSSTLFLLHISKVLLYAEMHFFHF